MAARVAVLVLGAALLGAFARAPTAHAASPARKAYVNGDSLGVGTASHLRAVLRRWRLNQTYDISRRLDSRTIADIRARRARLAPVLVISLGTNHDPRGGAQFGRDGVHPNSTGYGARARAIARAMERCRRSLKR